MAQHEGRREDPRLLTGQGRYLSDHLGPDLASAAFLRAGPASGRIVQLDVEDARAMPGVTAVLTAAELAADGIGPLTHDPLPREDGGTPQEYPQPLLAQDSVVHSGQAVALVVAETPAQAADAIEAIVLDIEDGPPPEGLAFARRMGDAAAVAQGFAGAAHRATVTLDIPRVTAFALEPRGAIARIDPEGRLDYRASTQNPFALKREIARHLDWDPALIRVRAQDVGGSFGLKGFMAVEDAVLCWAARRLGHSLAWVPLRSETMLADAQGRALTAEVSIALDAGLRILAVEAAYAIDAGAFPSRRSMGIVNNSLGLTGMYRVPAASVAVDGYLSARPPLAPFRGNGRPEATQSIERALDAVARQAGVDPVDLRRRNLVPPAEMPMITALGVTFDCGDFPAVMQAALDLNGDPEPRRAAAQSRGMLHGIGLANCIEAAGGPVRQPKPDCARLTVGRDGRVTVAPGVMSVGQGHETAMTRMAAQRLEIDAARIDYANGDTGAVTFGRGSGGSSGVTVAGAALHEALEALLDEGARLAAERLGCEVDDIVYRDGAFHRECTNQAADLAALAAARPEGAWVVETQFTPPAATFPNGTHICEVEIDPETGETRITRYAAVEDVGTVLNPVLVEGQLHGGVAQGLSLGLGERMAYDEEGQLLTGSLMEYRMLRATDMPPLRLGAVEVPTKNNPLGVKGVGEAGTVGATAALASAVSDALAGAGVADFDLPATPLRVWQALQAARGTR